MAICLGGARTLQCHRGRADPWANGHRESKQSAMAPQGVTMCIVRLGSSVRPTTQGKRQSGPTQFTQCCHETQSTNLDDCKGRKLRQRNYDPVPVTRNNGRYENPKVQKYESSKNRQNRFVVLHFSSKLKMCLLIFHAKIK